MKKKLFFVEFSVTGREVYSIEADDEQDALERALEDGKVLVAETLDIDIESAMVEEAKG